MPKHENTVVLWRQHATTSILVCPYMLMGTHKYKEKLTSKAAEIALPQIIDSWIWKYVVLCWNTRYFFVWDSFAVQKSTSVPHAEPFVVANVVLGM